MSGSTYRAKRMTTRDRLRSFALSLPEATEDFPWGESAIRVNRKVFVFLGPEQASGRRRATVKLDESNGHALSIEGAEPTRYGLGSSGWVTVPLRAPGVTLDLLHDWVEESYRIVAPKRLVAALDARSSPSVSSATAPARSRRPARPA
jgi:predicted DNA-binding protein (MmcQ/YjbR family)